MNSADAGRSSRSRSPRPPLLVLVIALCGLSTDARADWLFGGYFASEDLHVRDNLRFGSQYGAFASCRLVATINANPVLRNPAAPGCLSATGIATLGGAFGAAAPIFIAGLNRLSTVNNVGDSNANYLQDPVFRAALERTPEEDMGAAIGHYLSVYVNPSLTWDDLSEIRTWSGLPLVLKGVMTAEDARLAVEHGADAIVVSNHGGRQLDRVQAGVDALAEVVAAAGGRTEVWVDGGVRRGLDIAIALALGARGVLVGRPVYWALAAGGQAGVERAFAILRDEFEIALALLGARTPADVRPEHLVDPDTGPA